MEKGDYWMPLMIGTSIISPIALAHYSDVFLELSHTLVAFPWFCYDIRSGLISVYGHHFYLLNSPMLALVGIIWTLLGLVLIPIMRRCLRNSRWLTMLVISFSVLLLQSLIVQYGLSLTGYEYFYITILPLPIPSLLSLAIISVQYVKNRIALTN